MYPGIHNFSEIGKLNKVLLHRPGEELESLTPATLERLLFDDIPYLKVAQEEHDRFAEVLRETASRSSTMSTRSPRPSPTPRARSSSSTTF